MKEKSKIQIISKLLEILKEELPSNSSISTYPDHPLLSICPDILVGFDGYILALFIIKKDNANIRKIEAELISSRLGLPSHSIIACVSIDESIFEKNTFRNFDCCVDLKNTRQFVKTIKNFTPNIDKSSLKQSRYLHYVNYMSNLHIGSVSLLKRDMKDNEAHGVGSEIDFSYFRNLGKKWRNTKGIIIVNENLIGIKNINDDKNIIRSIESYSVQSFNELYRLDNGVPFKVKKDLNFIIRNNTFTSGFDPEKPVRSSAFSGWITTNTNEWESKSPVEYLTHMQERSELTEKRMLNLIQKG